MFDGIVALPPPHAVPSPAGVAEHVSLARAGASPHSCERHLRSIACMSLYREEFFRDCFSWFFHVSVSQTHFPQNEFSYLYPHLSLALASSQFQLLLKAGWAVRTFLFVFILQFVVVVVVVLVRLCVHSMRCWHALAPRRTRARGICARWRW